MKKIVVILMVMVFAGCGFAGETRDMDLAAGFQTPPDSAKPWVYWWWLDSNVSKVGITADLEAMKKQGIAGALVFDAGVGGPLAPDGPKFMNPQWREHLKFTLQEADRPGIEISLNLCSGWNAGGPWVKPESAAKKFAWSEATVRGGRKLDQQLPVPTGIKRNYYRDSAVLAFRISEQEGQAISKLTANSSYPKYPPALASDRDLQTRWISNGDKPGQGPTPKSPEFLNWEFAVPFPVTSLIVTPYSDCGPKDCEFQYSNDGKTYQTICRFVVPEGQEKSVAFDEREAKFFRLVFTSSYPYQGKDSWNVQVSEIALLKKGQKNPASLTTQYRSRDADSWEMSSQNWTPGFRQEFKKRRGYDAWPYFPVYSGCVVGSREISERFLWDVRLTCHELLLENHIGHMKKLCHERGLKLSIEPYDMNPTNDLDLGSFADIPMGEFWHNNFNSAWSCIEAVSIGHIMGKPIVAAEAFTAVGTYWKQTPWTLKDQSDWAFAAGINRFVIVTFAHQPWLDRSPGMMFAGYGLHWERTQTFWPMVDAYHQYLARCSHLLQQGVTVADILYLTPEGAPHVFRAPDSALHDVRGRLPDKKGYGFDACSPRILINRAKVKKGKIVFPGGTSYSVMVLPEYKTMTPKLLAKIAELVKDGATVIGCPPMKSPSLSDYPKCDDEVK